MDRYQIDVAELGDLRMCDIPPHSHLEIVGLPAPAGTEVEVYGLNPDNPGSYEGLCVYGGVGFRIQPDEVARTALRLQQAFAHTAEDEHGLARNPQVSTRIEGAAVLAHMFLNIDCSSNPRALVRHAIAAYLVGLSRLSKPVVHTFICYASEDRAQARELASSLSRLGADIWLDEREIRVGDSIGQRINDALAMV